MECKQTSMSNHIKGIFWFQNIENQLGAYEKYINK